MKISYNWIKELVNIDYSAREAARILTSIGMESNVFKVKVIPKGVVTAKVIECSKHSNADKLSLCVVNDGNENYDVVCGAPNVKEGLKVAFAKLGTDFEGGFKIEKRKIRGIESSGMICSEKELGLSDKPSGIMVLDNDTPLGIDLNSIINSGDTVIEVEPATNRPDCLNHIGIARELSAFSGRKLSVPVSERINISGGLQINVKDEQLCTRYIGVRISNVEVKDSPKWLRDKLKSCGLRPINNIVDITNYVLLEFGHPVHAFDLNKLSNNELIIRKAKNNEEALALDGNKYKLTEDMLVIADALKPQAIAGVTGCEDSGVTKETKEIILESAHFNPANIRRTSRKLNLRTDSSCRFERGTSFENVEDASNRATQLIKEIANGTVVSKTDIISKKQPKISINLRNERIKRLLGIEIDEKEVKRILSGLGINFSLKSNVFCCDIPSWRLDINCEADLIEEVARHYGYDKIPTTIPAIYPDINADKDDVDPAKILTEGLVALGYYEVMNYSLMSGDSHKKIGIKPYRYISNPLSKENEILRSSLLPGLSANIETNIASDNSNIRVFECGHIFKKDNEINVLGIINHGKLWEQYWQFTEDENKAHLVNMDFYSLCGEIKALFKGQEFKVKKSENIENYYHPGKCADILVNGKVCGRIGVLNPEYSGEYICEVIYAQIEPAVIEWNCKVPEYTPWKAFPPVKRDLSIVADKNTKFDIIFDKLSELVITNDIFEAYGLYSKYSNAEKIGESNKSYTLHLTFRHFDRTLTDQEVNKCVEIILKGLKEINVSLRS